MIWYIILGTFVYLSCAILTHDILWKIYFFCDEAVLFGIFWPIFWTIYLSYHILKYPGRFFVNCSDKFTTFVAERMN